MESLFHEFAFFFFLQSHLHVRPPHLPLSRSQSTVGTSSKRPPPVSDRATTFWASNLLLATTWCILWSLSDLMFAVCTLPKGGGLPVVCLVPQAIWHLPPDWFAPLRWLTLLIWLRRQRRGRKLGCPYPKYCGYSPWSCQRRLYQRNWIVAKDLTHKALYYRTYNDLTVRVKYLDKVQPQRKRLKLGGFKDTTDELKLLTFFFELQLTVWLPKVEPSYTRMRRLEHTY